METLPVTISPSKLIEFLFLQLNNLPDKRKGSNTTYEIRETVIAAFSVFFTQCPSFLEHQNLMKKKRGKDNAFSLFGLKKIPSDNQIRTLLDPIPATTVFETFKTVWEWLRENKILNHFKYLDEEILLAIDGTEYYSSKKINCPHCNCRHHRNGTTTYYHQVITPVIVAPDQKQVINLEPEFISQQDGKTKQANRECSYQKMVIKKSSPRKKSGNNFIRG